MSTLGRRRLLTLAGGALVAGCGTSATPNACATAGAGPGLGYCLVGNRVLRVPGGAKLAAGEVLLFSESDATAAIVARDAGGLYALSAICTHACCAVALCGGVSCAAPTSAHGECSGTSRAALAATGAAFLCPCHGSEFDASGLVLTGPATLRLPSVRVAIDGSDALVDLSLPASPTDRLPV